MTVQVTREIRFAVVLYGGSSLAIYMNGISQELLRMVRATSSRPADELDEVETIYREMSEALTGQEGQRTRFVIDIISGTSAGGINGVALAKALVQGAPDLDLLREAWVEKADIERLLNDHAPANRRMMPAAESLLDGQLMYDLLGTTLAGMSKASGSGPLTTMLDLFVTTTDLAGRPVPIQLTGTVISEPVHKAVFRFGFDQQLGRNDFTAPNDPMLAFAARCTSSFPVAFPPMSVGDLPGDARDAIRRHAARFPGKAIDEGRQYADGGYLDNRPFSHAIDLIPLRGAELPGKRVLLFVDPFPDPPESPDRGPERYDFLQNARLAAMTLPRRETIRDDLRAITTLNRRLERLGALHSRWEADKAHLPDEMEPGVEDPEAADLGYFLGKGYGPAYPLYHHLRVYVTSDTLSNLVGRLAGFDPQSDETAFLRQIIRAWRSARFAPYATPGMRTETAFLSDFDLDYRLRRLAHLRARSHEAGDAAPEGLRQALSASLGHYRRLLNLQAEDAAILLDDDRARRLRGLLEDCFAPVMRRSSFEARFEAAKEVYARPEIRDLVDQAMQRLGQAIRGTVETSNAEIKAALAGSMLERDFDCFHWHDVITFPFLDGSQAEEHSEVQVFRISPADSTINPDPGKLAGIAAGAFGGFLKKEWREHDIMWGRLDAADRIVEAVWPEGMDQDGKAAYRRRLHEAILRDEFDDLRCRDRYMALLNARIADRRLPLPAEELLASQALGLAARAEPPEYEQFRNSFSSLKPLGPDARSLTRWSSQSAAILSRMIDGLPAHGTLALMRPRLSGGLRIGAALSSRLLRFSLPGSYRRAWADHAAGVMIVAGLVIIALAAFVDGLGAGLGLAIICATVAVWTSLYMLGRVLRGQAPLRGAAVLLACAVAAALLATGAVTTWNGAIGIFDNAFRNGKAAGDEPVQKASF